MKNFTKIFQAISGIFLVNIAEMGLRMAMSVILARILGPSGYGSYSYAITLVLILTMVSLVGSEQLVIREIAKYVAINDWPRVSGLVRLIKKYVFTASLIVTFAATGIAFTWTEHNCWSDTIIIGFFLLPFVSFIRLHECLLRGLNYVVIAQIPNKIIRPVFFLAVIIILFFIKGDEIKANTAMFIQLIVCILTFCFIWFLFRRKFSSVEQKKYTYEKKEWHKGMTSFFFIGVLWVLSNNINIIIIKLLLDAKAVGFFNIARRISELVGLGILIINIAIGPRISHLFVQKRQKELQKLLFGATTLAFIFSSFVSICFFTGNRTLITLLFGKKFLPALNAIMILCVGQLLRVAMGPVEQTLNMTGFERDTFTIAIGAFSLNIASNIVCIKLWGLEGAAIATAATLVIWNAFMMYFVHRRTGLHTSLIGFWSIMKGKKHESF